MRRDTFEDPFEVARREAGARGVCPILRLDGFFTEHWDHYALCAAFGCATCAGDPMDDYLAGADEWCPAWSGHADAAADDLEIPF